MTRTIRIQKATRVEGNAAIHLEVEEGRVKAARFMVQDFRGFLKLCEGVQVESVPHVLSRICGLCSAAHQVACLEAVENALCMAIHPAVSRLRTVCVLGERIASHALSYFFLTLPGALGASRGVFDLIRTSPELAGDALSLRKAGLRIVEVLGKRAVHPVSLGVGRFLIPPTASELEEVRAVAASVRETAAALIYRVGGKAPEGDRIPFPVEHRVNFLSYDDRKAAFLPFDRSGAPLAPFSRDTFEERIAELRVDWSFAKFPYLAPLGFPDGILLVGPLSRCLSPDGPLADPEVAGTALAERVRDPLRLHLDDLDACRLLEVLDAARRILRLLEGDALPEPAAPLADLEGSGSGIGVVEAPRGTLVHRILVKRGIVERVRLLVATQFNNAYINLLMRDLAGSSLENGDIPPSGRERIGRCVRTFDPCLSCATH